jgi:hypothetical protein
LSPQYPNLAEYNSVISILRSAQKLRNTYAHHGISKNPDTGNFEIATGSARGKLSVKVEAVSLHDIRRASVAINEAMRALYKLVLNVDVPPPWETRIPR